MFNRRLFATAAVAALFSCFISATLSACGNSAYYNDMEESDTYHSFVFSDDSTEEGEADTVIGVSVAPTFDTVQTTDEDMTGTVLDGTIPDITQESYTDNSGTDLSGSSSYASSSATDTPTTAGQETKDTTDDSSEYVTNTAGVETSVDATQPGTTENEIQSSQVQQVENPTQSSDHSVEFIFKVPGYTGKSYYDLYLNDGFVPVGSVSELREYCRDELLTLKNGNKSVNYVITPQGIFDDIADGLVQMDVNVAQGGDIRSVYARDAYLYEQIGLDYQTYYSRGMSIFKIKKMGDVGSGKHSIYAIYYYSYEDARQTEKVDAIADKVVQGYAGSDYDKILFAYDYLCDNTVYSDDAEDYESHSAYGAFVSGKAVCEGYAKAYKILLDKMGIPNYIVINSTHAWNVVMYDGEWYFVDVTNGDFNSCYAYFMLGSDVLCNAVDMTIDYYVFSAEAIAYYGYTDGSNTDDNVLAADSVSERVIIYR